MKIFKWIFHPAVVVVAIVAVAVYLNRSELTTEEHPVSNSSSHKVAGIPLVDGSKQPADNLGKAGESDQMAVTATTSTGDHAGESDIAEGGADIPALGVTVQVHPDDIEVTTEASVPVEGTATQESDTAVSDAGNTSSPAVAPTVAVVAQPQSTATPSNTAQKTDAHDNEAGSFAAQARMAASQGRAEEAVLFYERAASSNPKDIDIQGELGDMYLSVGRVDDAIAAYTKAATLLNENGQPMRAWEVVNYIGMFSQEKALSLGDQLFMQK